MKEKMKQNTKENMTEDMTEDMTEVKQLEAAKYLEVMEKEAGDGVKEKSFGRGIERADAVK